ncbi:MAG: ATP-binding protein [Cyclobacteriaceae bacterium]
MHRFFQNILRLKPPVPVVDGNEIDAFFEYFERKKASEVWNQLLEDRLTFIRKQDRVSQIDYFIGLFLLFERSLRDHKSVIGLRSEFKNRFPNIAKNKYFRLIYEPEEKQEMLLSGFLLELIEQDCSELMGNSRQELFRNFEYQLEKSFEQLKFGGLTKPNLVSTLNYEVTLIYQDLTQAFGNQKVRGWFQQAYAGLTENFQFLESFNFLLSILPESQMSEHQLNLLNRSQIEDALLRKTDELEDINLKLKEEIAVRGKIQSELKDKAEQLRSLIETAMDAVVILDSNGNVQLWNIQAENIFGWSENEVINKPLADFIVPPDKRGDHINGMRNYLATGVNKMLNQRVEEMGMTKRGDLIPLELSIVANEVEGELVFTSFIRDISDQKKAKEALEDAKENAERASMAKADFLSTMSHEIRTPMNGLSGTIDFLLSENPREDQLESLNLMKQSSEALLVILNDILDFTKIDEGRIELDEVDFSITEVCNNVISTYKQKANDKGIKLFFKADMDIPDLLVGDPVRFGQVLNNLVSNAIKFTKEGSVEMSVEFVKEAKESARFMISVSDTGIGISKENLDTIFERFSQVHNRQQHRVGGTGLGLAISKRLLNLQGGELKVESEIGEGAKFYFEIEFNKSNSVGKQHGNQTSLLKNLNGLSILLVEDNHVNQIVASKFLLKWGCQVDMVFDGKEALEALEKNTYNLILMDIQMPVMNGFDTTSAIRAKDDTYSQEVPIVALSADVLPEVTDKCLSVGMNDVMGKPFDPEVLYKTIVKYTSVGKVNS